eukprot:4370443-Prymnesium_polylepis.1
MPEADGGETAPFPRCTRHRFGQRGPSTAMPFRLAVHKVAVLRLHRINHTESTFNARIWVSFYVQGGALDEDLSKKGVHFPMGADGIPTFKPSLAWYGEQIEFPNGLAAPRRIEMTTIRKEDDLYLNCRWDGVFHEDMELHDFPFDKQALTITIVINSRTKGKLPVEISVDNTLPSSIVRDGFAQQNQYHLSPTLFLRVHELGNDEDRKFPAISISCMVERRPRYYILNAGVPFCAFSLLSLSQFAVSPTRSVDGVEMLDAGAINHRAQLSLTVVLTAAAYKMAVGAMLPRIAYLTLLDRYMLVCSTLIILIALQSRSLSWFVDLDADASTINSVDKVCFGVLIGAWLFYHARVIWVSVQTQRNMMGRDATFRHFDDELRRCSTDGYKQVSRVLSAKMDQPDRWAQKLAGQHGGARSSWNESWSRMRIDARVAPNPQG